MKICAQVTIAADHPAFAGHFPGSPILPGVVLLDLLLRSLETGEPQTERRWQVLSAKFLKVVQPGETLTIAHESTANGHLKFLIASGEFTVASGMLAPA